MKRPDDRVSKYNGFQIPDYLINRNIEYLVTRTDEITNRQISYITDNLVDSVIIEEYWRQIYRLLGDRFNRSYYDNNNLVRIAKLPLKSDKEDISDKVAIPTEISVDLYSQGYLIGECSVNLENGFVSDMSIYIKYNPDDWLDKVYFNHKRTYKSFSKEENCTIQCEIITPLKYCKSIIRRNFEERLRKWSKRARVIYLSIFKNVEEGR